MTSSDIHQWKYAGTVAAEATDIQEAAHNFIYLFEGLWNSFTTKPSKKPIQVR